LYVQYLTDVDSVCLKQLCKLDSLSLCQRINHHKLASIDCSYQRINQIAKYE